MTTGRTCSVTADPEFRQAADLWVKRSLQAPRAKSAVALDEVFRPRLGHISSDGHGHDLSTRGRDPAHLSLREVCARVGERDPLAEKLATKLCPKNCRAAVGLKERALPTTARRNSRLITGPSAVVLKKRASFRLCATVQRGAQLLGGSG